MLNRDSLRMKKSDGDAELLPEGKSEPAAAFAIVLE